MLVMSLSSCEAYLDKSPDMGLTEEVIYSNYDAFRGFFENAYVALENILSDGGVRGRQHKGTISDEFATTYNSSGVITVQSGNWLKNSSSTIEIGNTGETIISTSYQTLRVVNRVIADIDRVPGMTQEQHDYLLGQARFMRAWFYFQLITRYGGMPKLDKVFNGDGDQNVERMTYHESHAWMMEDIDAAIALLPDAWDTDNTGRVNKIAAMAFKEQAQLYDASPLMQNSLTTLEVKPYDQERAKLAAQSAQAVLDYVEAHPELGYRMMPTAEYKNIFYWPAPPYMQPEFLWYNRAQASNMKNYMRKFWLPAEYAKGTGNDAVSTNSPTQNMVDLFEKRGADGIYYPISDPRSGYDLQAIFTDRDPRLHNNILVPGERWGVNANNKAQYITTYEGGTSANTFKNSNQSNKRQQTGYLCKKFLWEGADQWKELYDVNRCITVYIRLAQVYLDLAEASFEATGSATQVVDGCKLTAEQALNVVRNRAGITNLPADLVADPEKFREAYRRERGVELMFENQHRWFDIRRWMTMHTLFGSDPYPIKGLRATPKNANHAKVTDKSTLEFTYEVVDVVPEVRGYGMRNYWYPFPMDEANFIPNLVQNPGW
jgi:hypothetical protein